MAGRLPIQISLVALSSAFSVGLAYGQAAPATAGQATAGNLAPVEVNRRREDTRAKLEHIMREVDGPKITVTKKTSVSVTDQQPELTQLSGRNLFIRTPGLIAADLPAGSPTELSYRGFSPTQGAGYVAVLQDGLPISNDAAAASIVSFSPLSQGLAQVQLIRGGAGLIYGPTPVGAVNLVSRRPHPGEPPNVGTEQVGGSNGLYSTYNFIEGAEGTIEYRASLGYQAVDGRQVNSASRLGAADSFLGWRPVKGELFYLDLHAYQAQAGDPGMADAPHDHHWTRRMSATLGAEVDAADGWRFEGKLWANYLETTARAAALSLAVFDDQTYRTLGVDMRLRHSFGRGNAFTMGLTADQDTSPRRQWLAANLEAAPLRLREWGVQG